MGAAALAAMAAGGAEAAPLDAAEFAALMAPLGPFEPRPLLACGVSGGPDSLALLLLSLEWAAARGGSVLALTVDHGLRPASAGEARAVAALARRLGVQHRTLLWDDPVRQGAIQAAARAARRRLLEAAAVEAGCLHLLLAHHRDDQAETLLLRATRGSGPDGLAGMAPESRRPGLRLLRPLLPIPKARLEASLAARGLAWVCDPSNEDERYRRVRLRRALAAAPGEEATTASEQLADAAATFARLRGWSEARVAEALGRAAMVHPAGCVRLREQLLSELPEPLALRVLAGVIEAVGGAIYPPRGGSLVRLLSRLRAGLPAEGRSATLGGCRVLRQDGGLLIVREAAAAQSLAIRPGESLVWDGRFRVTLAPLPPGSALDPEGFRLGPLGSDSRAGLAAGPGGAGGSAQGAVPGAARAALPALRYLDALLCVPHLNLWRPGPFPAVVDCVASPPRSAARPGFTCGVRGGILSE